MKLQADIEIPDNVVPGGKRGEQLIYILEDVLSTAVVGLYDGATVGISVTEEAAKIKTFKPKAFRPKTKRKKKSAKKKGGK